jgi:hypothetical protein
MRESNGKLSFKTTIYAKRALFFQKKIIFTKKTIQKAKQADHPCGQLKISCISEGKGAEKHISCFKNG